ncbi:DUF1378 family protein [Citrobacter braakii]|uniref:DUF1378 family protein n=1 Tax=Citrobacter braakii TaxID=57706 RepID=UPI001906A043|nr:DUF1378 family protein [Citrobacter braakii]MBJ9144263.1 DUF1378 family protein [Citrobacter braakii]
MTFMYQIMLYFSTAVCALYLVSGGYKVIRNYVRKKIDDAAQEKLKNKTQPTTSQVNNQTLP